METLQKTQASITINDNFVKQLYHVNYLVNYPISDIMLEGWTRSINELMPEATPQDIKFVIDKMKLGEIKFDSRKGVQNILVALKSYTKKSYLDPKTNKW
jgi:hypothetical protein